MADGLLLQPDHVRRLNEVLRWFEQNKGSLGIALRNQQIGRGHILSNAGTIIGKLTTTLSQGGSCTVEIWDGPGNSETDSGNSITAYDWLMKSGAADISSGKKVVCQLINGNWYVTEAECEDTGDS